MSSKKVCECCGHPIPERYETFYLTRTQQKLFRLVERAGQAGIAYRDLLDEMYADDPDGGPDSPNILHIQRTKANTKLAEHNLKIASSGGHYAVWRLARIEAA